MEQSSSLEIPPSQRSTLKSKGRRYWYERYCEQRAETERLNQRVKELEEQFETLTEKLRKLTGRTSETSSQTAVLGWPEETEPGINKSHSENEAPLNYNHPGTTRNGFGWIDHSVLLDLQRCPVCGGVRWSGNLRGTQRPAGGRTGAENLVEVWSTSGPCINVLPADGRVTRTYRSDAERGLAMADG